MKIQLIGFTTILLFGLITILPLFHPGFIPVHDSPQIARVFEMHKALVDGHFPVRIVQDLGYGYGYPIFTYYAPLSYYIGGILSFLLQPLIATKVMIGLGMVLAGVSMYLLGKVFLRTEAAITAALLYLFVPYHAVNLYVRGAVGELYAYAFLPLAFYGLLRVKKDHSLFSVLVAGLALAGVILSHNLTAMMLIPFYAAFFLYLLMVNKKKENMLYLLGSVALGIGLACFYWLPALLEMKYTNVSSLTTGGSVYKDHFVCLSQLWNSQWGFGGSGPSCIDGLSFQIGKVHVLLGIIGLILLFFHSRYRRVLFFSLLGGVISIIMLLRVSQPVWDSLAFLHYIQFPWRYLQFISFFLSLTGGIVISILPELPVIRRFSPLVVFASSATIAVLILLFYAKYFTPQRYLTSFEDQTKRSNLVWDISKISDEYLPASFVKPKSQSEVPTFPFSNINGVVSITSNKTQRLDATIQSPTQQEITLNKAAFPFWQVKVNNAVVQPLVRGGKYVLNIPKGESRIIVSYSSTPVEKIANTISLISLGIALLAIIERIRPSRHAKTH